MHMVIGVGHDSGCAECRAGTSRTIPCILTCDECRGIHGIHAATRVRRVEALVAVGQRLVRRLT